MKKVLFISLVLFAFVSCSRQPYDVPEFVEIGTNETAFIVPLTGNTSDQTQLMSEDYLRKNMVASKRVQIPHEWVKTGRKANQGEWKDTIAVIKVDRTPVSVTWSVEPKNTRVGVESKESIGFTVPISLTAMIYEEDAPKFLNKYTSSSLSTVVNTDVNAFIRTEASARFGVLTLEQCKDQKKVIFDAIFAETKTFFKQYGITISQGGLTDGFIYDNAEIQKAIDEQAKLQAEGKALVEKENNAKKNRDIDLKNAQNEAAIAATKASSVGSLKALQEVENSRILAEAQAEAIKLAAKDLKLPDVVPEGVFYNLGLDKFVPTARK